MEANAIPRERASRTADEPSSPKRIDWGFVGLFVAATILALLHPSAGALYSETFGTKARRSCERCGESVLATAERCTKCGHALGTAHAPRSSAGIQRAPVRRPADRQHAAAS